MKSISKFASQLHKCFTGKPDRLTPRHCEIKHQLCVITGILFPWIMWLLLANRCPADLAYQMAFSEAFMIGRNHVINIWTSDNVIKSIDYWIMKMWQIVIIMKIVIYWAPPIITSGCGYSTNGPTTFFVTWHLAIQISLKDNNYALQQKTASYNIEWGMIPRCFHINTSVRNIVSCIFVPLPTNFIYGGYQDCSHHTNHTIATHYNVGLYCITTPTCFNKYRRHTTRIICEVPSILRWICFRFRGGVWQTYLYLRVFYTFHSNWTQGE